MEKEKDAKAQGDLAWSLGPLTDRLGTDEAARICQPGAERLSKALKEEARNLDERGFSLVKGLGAMLIRLPQDQAVQAIQPPRYRSRGDERRMAIANSGLLLSRR